MATTIDEAAIPAVTIPGEELFGILVALLRAEDEIARALGDAEELNEPIGRLWRVAFGRMFRDCDKGLGDGCEGSEGACLACNGDEYESATPLYRRALEAARAAA